MTRTAQPTFRPALALGAVTIQSKLCAPAPPVALAGALALHSPAPAFARPHTALAALAHSIPCARPLTHPLSVSTLTSAEASAAAALTLATPNGARPLAAVVPAAIFKTPSAMLIQHQLAGCELSAEPSAKRQRKQPAVRTRANLYFCNCLREWPRPAGTQGNPHHAPECARRRRTEGRITVDPVVGEVLCMLPSVGDARPAVCFVGPGSEDWEAV